MKHLAAAMIALSVAGPVSADMVIIPTDRSVAEAMDALEAAVTGAGATVFARVDHAAGAESVAMDLPEAQLLIFGNPRLGTPVMQQDIAAALALPLRMAVYEDAGGQVVIAYETVETMMEGLDVDPGAEVFARMRGALENFAAAASGG